MKKIFFAAFFVLLSVGANAQYSTINAILDELEARKGIKNNLKEVNLDNKKFVLIKNFEDHTERQFIVLKGNSSTFVEIFDDKKTGQSSSNVFTGDFVRSKNNIVSIRADELEGKKIAMPITKTLLLTKQKKILYLIDINSQERWIDETSFNDPK